MRPVPLRRALAVLAGGLLVLVAWTAVALLLARGDLLAARAGLQAARAQGAAGAEPALALATRQLRAADRVLGQPGPWIVGHLPLVGRTVTAVRTTAQATGAVTAAGHDLLALARTAGLRRGSGVDLVAAQRLTVALEHAAARTRAPLRQLDAVPTGLTPGVVAQGVRDARATLDGVDGQLDRAARALEGLRTVLGADRPQHLLICLENNAELRGTGGVVTVFAEAQARGGQLRIGPFRDVADVRDDASKARRVPAPSGYRSVFGVFKADTTLWLNTNMDPDVPTSSAVLAQIAQATLHRRPDAVLWLDARAIQAVLSATGPARLPDGSPLTADNAVRVLLSDAYAGAGNDDASQGVRRARLRAVADTVARRITGSGSGSAAALAVALARAADGRHVALWSADAVTEQALADGGLAGSAEANGTDLVQFTVQNLGGGAGEGNKLDYYARRQLSVAVRLDRGSALVEQTIQLRNNAPRRGLPRYVAGIDQPGTTNNYATFAVPRDAALLAFERGGRPVGTSLLPLGDHLVLTDLVSISPGTTASWTLRYRLPLRDGSYRLRVLPQPLAVDAGVRVEVRGAGGTLLRAPSGAAAGQLVVSRALTGPVDLPLTAEQPSRWRRLMLGVRRFWTEPVRL